MSAVVIDVERLRNVHCGLGQFCLHLTRAILDAATDDIDPVLLVPRLPGDFFGEASPRCLPTRLWRAQPAANLLRPWLYLFRPGPGLDLWHATHQDSRYLPLDPRIPLILTIHDLNFLREKSASTIRSRLRSLQAKANRAAVVTTASQFAADEIREHLTLDDKEIVVIPHGVCVQPADCSGNRPAYVDSTPFLFTIGDVTAKKNFHVLVDLAAELPDYRFVIAGSRSSDYARFVGRRIAEAGLEHRVLLPGAVSDGERNWLYQNCTAFLFPSLSEGFGLPLIEAMSCGKPVFSSATTSLPEVGGSAAFYWHDMTPSAMANVVRRGMQSAAEDPDFATRMRRHAGQFTWSRAAQEYLALYKRVLVGHPPRYPARRSRSRRQLSSRNSTVRPAA